MQLSKQTIGILCAVITVAIWSSFIIIARAMAHKTLTPLDIAFVRMVGAAIVMLPWGWWWVRRARQRAEPGAATMWLGLSPYPWRITAWRERLQRCFMQVWRTVDFCTHRLRTPQF